MQKIFIYVIGAVLVSGTSIEVKYRLLLPYIWLRANSYVNSSMSSGCGVFRIRRNKKVSPTDDNANLEQEVAELVEMVPFEKVMSLAMDYAIADPQVSSLLGYLSGSKFKENIAALENSPQFSQVADIAELYHIDAYALANKVNRALEMPLVNTETHRRVAYRRRRAPGDGVAAFVKEAVASLPLAEIKEAYKYKVENNPQFRSLVERLVSGDARPYLEPLLESAPVLETRRDLEELGLPLSEIQEFLEQTTTAFFELEAMSSTLPPHLPTPTS